MPLTAAEIIERVHFVYSTCRTYQDEGECVSKMNGQNFLGGGHERRQPFRTAFVRPARFFFEYKWYYFDPSEEWNRGVICATERGVVRWWTIGSLAERDKTLDLAIAGFTGVSGCAAHDVPRLLLPNEVTGSPTLPDPASAVLLDEREQDGLACFVLQGSPHSRAPSITAWIDQRAFTLHRIDRRLESNSKSRAGMADGLRRNLASMSPDEPRDVIEKAVEATERDTSGDFVCYTTTTWRPIIDGDIDPGMFEFRPPYGA